MTLPAQPRNHQVLHLRLLLALVCSSSLVACGWFRNEDKQPEYYGAVETPDLAVPAGLDQPVSTGALVINIPQAPLPKSEMVTVPPRVASDVGNKNENTILKWSSEGAYLWVKDSPESVQRRLGFVIDRATTMVRKAPAGDALAFDYRHEHEGEEKGFFGRMAFWRDDGPDYSGSYQVVIEADAEDTRVFVKDADGSESDPQAVEHLLNVFAERLG